MKKIKYFIFTLLLLLLIPIVNAKSRFNNRITVEQSYSQTSVTENYSKIIKTADGYIYAEGQDIISDRGITKFSNIDYNISSSSSLVLTCIGYDNKVIWTESYGDVNSYGFDLIMSEDNKIILVTYTGTLLIDPEDGAILKSSNIPGDDIEKLNNNYVVNDHETITIIDKNLNVIKTIDNSIFSDSQNGIWFDDIVVDNNIIYILTYKEIDDTYVQTIAKLDSNYNKISEIEITLNDSKYIFDVYYDIEIAVVNDVVYVADTNLYQIKNGKITIIEEANENELSSIYTTIRKIDKYLVAGGAISNSSVIGMTTDIEGTIILKPLLSIYDFNMNLIETIKPYNNLESGIVYSITDLDSSFVAKGYTYNEDNYLKFFKEYSISYSINVKKSENGTINVDKEQSPSGEEVTFTITPKKGYVLSEVKVTDMNGKIITLTANTFTMPSSDVTIEAIFIKQENNPNTTDIAIISCIAVIILGAIGTIYSIKKISWLK